MRAVDGRPEESVKPWEECITIYRALASDGAHQAALLHVANMLTLFAKVKIDPPGRRNEAIADLVEATGIYRDNAQIVPQSSAGLVQLANALLAKLRVPS